MTTLKTKLTMKYASRSCVGSPCVPPNARPPSSRVRGRSRVGVEVRVRVTVRVRVRVRVRRGQG
jgi:hypothetical protein